MNFIIALNMSMSLATGTLVDIILDLHSWGHIAPTVIKGAM